MKSWSEVIDCEKGMYLFADEWLPVGERGEIHEDMGYSRAALTGFLGMIAPWSAMVLAGTTDGPVRLTVEVHEVPAGDLTNIGHRWSEVIETTWQSRSGAITFRRLFGEVITTIDGLLPLGSWRMRAHAKGRDEGHAERAYTMLSAEPLEEHLIQFWPGPDHGGGGDLVLTQDRFGASIREQFVPQ